MSKQKKLAEVIEACLAKANEIRDEREFVKTMRRSNAGHLNYLRKCLKNPETLDISHAVYLASNLIHTDVFDPDLLPSWGSKALSNILKGIDYQIRLHNLPVSIVGGTGQGMGAVMAQGKSIRTYYGVLFEQKKHRESNPDSDYVFTHIELG